MTKTKQDLRKIILANRLATQQSAIAKNNEQIFLSLKELYDWAKFKNLHVYESIDSLNEVDTRKFITYIKEHYPEIEIHTARKINGVWQNVSLNNTPVDNTSYDAIIVPLLGFDKQLNRLGYGGGYYDRFLSKQNGAKKIGLGFEIGLVEKIMIEPYDIAMDFIISEKQIYSLNSIL